MNITGLRKWKLSWCISNNTLSNVVRTMITQFPNITWRGRCVTFLWKLSFTEKERTSACCKHWKAQWRTRCQTSFSYCSPSLWHLSVQHQCSFPLASSRILLVWLVLFWQLLCVNCLLTVWHLPVHSYVVGSRWIWM